MPPKWEDLSDSPPKWEELSDTPPQRPSVTSQGSTAGRVIGDIVAPPIVGAAKGIADIPVAIVAAAKAIAQARNVDWQHLLTHPEEWPSTAWETAKPIPRQMAPAILPVAGGVVGSLAGPWGVPVGAAGGELLNQTIEQLWTGQPKTYGEVVESVFRTGAGTGATMLIPGAVRQAAKLTGRGVFRSDPAAKEVFARQGVEPTAADLSGSRAAAMTEAGVGRLYGGAGVMQGAFEKTVQQVTDAFNRAKATLGRFGTREQVGKDAVREIEGSLKSLQKTGDKLKKDAETSMRPGDFIPSDALRAEAKSLLDEVLAANPGLVENNWVKRLRWLAADQVPAKLDKAGNVITPARDLTKLSLEDWWANNKLLGKLARGVESVADIPRGRAKDLYRATMVDLESANIPATPAVKAFKNFYKNEIVPFNESLPGRLVSGEVLAEDVGDLFSKTGIAQIADVRKYAPRQFDAIRNRWLGDEFAQANVVDPQKGFQPGNFRNWWRRIDPEVKAKAFDPQTIRNFDDLAFISERTARKFSPSMGGGLSGPAGILPLLQGGYMLKQAGDIVREAVAGSPLGVTLNVAELAASSLGPYAVAKMMTTPGGIRHLTTALQIPAGSREGMAILGRLGITGTQAQRKQSEVEVKSLLPAEIRRAVESTPSFATQSPQNSLRRSDDEYKNFRRLGITDADIQQRFGVTLTD